MSIVKIQGHASGTGTLIVTAPNTSTNRTLTLPDETGTLALAGASSSDYVHISTATVSSAVGTIEISLPVGYENFEIRFDLESTGRAHMHLHYSEDDGSSYLVTQYQLSSYNNNYTSSLTYSSADYSGNIMSQRGKFMQGIINLYKASSTTNTRFTAFTVGFDLGDGSDGLFQNGSGMSTSQSARIDKVKIVATGAYTYTSGKIALYGIKNS